MSSYILSTVNKESINNAFQKKKTPTKTTRGLETS